MQHHTRAAAAVLLLFCFYAPLRLSVSVLAPRAHPVPAAKHPPPHRASSAAGWLEPRPLGPARASEASLTGRAELLQWHPAYAEAAHERACMLGRPNYRRPAGLLSQAYAFVAALLELLQQLLVSVRNESRCEARYRSPGEIRQQAELTRELARAAKGTATAAPTQPQPQPQPQPPPRAQVFGEVLRLRHSRLWRFSYGACSLPYHAIVWYHVRTSLSTFLPATSLRARGPSEREPVDHDGPEAWAAYLDGVRARERVRERGRRHRAARAARQRAVRAMGRVELPPAMPNRGRARRLGMWRGRRRFAAVLVFWTRAQMDRPQQVGGGSALDEYQTVVHLKEGGRLELTTELTTALQKDLDTKMGPWTVALPGKKGRQRAGSTKQPVVLTAAAIQVRLPSPVLVMAHANPVVAHLTPRCPHCTCVRRSKLARLRTPFCLSSNTKSPAALPWRSARLGKRLSRGSNSVGEAN